ncbi:MAG: nucleoside kinase [Erysipelotrichaceae bacterium]|nr:nucleoside kinase [Erysipelotrichaceae bacterium]
MNKILVTLPDGSARSLFLQEGETALRAAQLLQKENPYPYLLCRIRHETKRLTVVLNDGDELQLLDLRDSSANLSMQSSLAFLYTKAVHDVLGSSVPVTIANSLSKGVFTQIRTSGIRNETAKAISWHMQEMINEDLPFEEVGRNGQMTEYRLDGELQSFVLPLVPSTGCLNAFEVRRYKNGMLLRFPHRSDPLHVPPYEEESLIYDAYSEASRWDKILGVHYADDLNRKIDNGEFEDMVLLSEALHEKRVAEIAEAIRSNNKRIILIAGPSSSGKTSFAKRLCIQLRVIGLRPIYLGTDDYFKERSETPLDEDGNKDYESLNAIDTVLFGEQMTSLLKGKKTDIPTYDFIKGEKIFGKRITTAEPNQPIVIEGIHGLNPLLTMNIPEDTKYRIYISPLTQLNIDPLNRIPVTDTRLLRRIVRDNRYRGYDAAHTITSWLLVRAGEEKYIFPFTDYADTFFNSSYIYEFGVLKKYAEPLLKEIPAEDPAYPEAQRLLASLSHFTASTDEGIPNNSLLREFIGGSVLVHKETE